MGAVRTRVQTVDKNITIIHMTPVSGLKIKRIDDVSLHKMLIDGLEWCGLLVDYCDVFFSCLDSHSDGTHSLQRINW